MAFALLLWAWASPAFAERYALLAGISHYANPALDLEGPAEDVPALRRLLVERHGFAERNVMVLVDAAATRQGILDRLTGLVAGMHDGDYLMFYFSGHGTSAFDAQMQPVSAFIGPNSGALAPHDLQMDSPERAAASLLIGRRDLRPILERLPKGSQALVILDACYSENAMRAIPQRSLGRTRGITLGTTASGGSGGAASTATGAALTAAAEAERAYPYPNVFALTAASKDEQAKDIDSRMKVNGAYPTVDGRPHGAFTNSLLEALSGAGDVNRDGTLTLQELFEYSRTSVQARFPHTPQLLVPPSLAPTSVAALGTVARPAVAAECRPDAAPAGDGDITRVRVDADPALAARFNGAAGVRVVATGADLTVVQGAGGLVDLFDASGSLVRQFRASEMELLLARVAAEPALQRFIGLRLPCPAFSATLQLTPAGQSRFSARDRMTMQAVVERDAHLALFNIDKSGAVSLVYPATAAERGGQAAARPVMLGTVRAVAPFGSEHLKLLAFREAPPFDQLGCRAVGAGGLECPDIVPGTAAFQTLLDWVRRAAPVAESHIRFTTFEE
jgi:uncharacterized caspase-like protein